MIFFTVYQVSDTTFRDVPDNQLFFDKYENRAGAFAPARFVDSVIFLWPND
jgi:hypothetical protein